MVQQLFDATDGHPIFLADYAPDLGVDETVVAEYAADVGNRIVRANFAALDAYAFKREGLRGYASDSGIEYVYKGSAWVIPARFATWTYAKASAADTTIIEDGTLTAVTGESTNATFVTGVAGSKVTLMPGVYVAVFAVAMGAAITGRTSLEITAGTRTTRNNPVVGDDQASVTAQFMLSATTQVSFKVYKQTGGAQNLTGHLTIQKVE